MRFGIDVARMTSDGHCSEPSRSQPGATGFPRLQLLTEEQACEHSTHSGQSGTPVYREMDYLTGMRTIRVQREARQYPAIHRLNWQNYFFNIANICGRVQVRKFQHCAAGLHNTQLTPPTAPVTPPVSSAAGRCCRRHSRRPCSGL